MGKKCAQSDKSIQPSLDHRYRDLQSLQIKEETKKKKIFQRNMIRPSTLSGGRLNTIK